MNQSTGNLAASRTSFSEALLSKLHEIRELIDQQNNSEAPEITSLHAENAALRLQLQQSVAHVEAFADTVRQRDEALARLAAVENNSQDVVRQREVDIEALRADLLVATSTIERRDAEFLGQARELSTARRDHDNLLQNYNRVLEENQTLVAQINDVRRENACLLKNARLQDESSSRQQITSSIDNTGQQVNAALPSVARAAIAHPPSSAVTISPTLEPTAPSVSIKHEVSVKCEISVKREASVKREVSVKRETSVKREIETQLPPSTLPPLGPSSQNADTAQAFPNVVAAARTYPTWMTERVPSRYLEKLVVVSRPVRPDATNLEFKRSWLSAQIGGSSQSAITNVAAGRSRFNVTAYCAPEPSGNPWLPRAPGESGWVFIGLSKSDHHDMGRGEKRELFVRFGEGRYVYFGTYNCHREDPLLVDEFNQLDWSVEYTSSARKKGEDSLEQYCTWTSKKGSADIGSPADARRKYESGDLRVPCVRLDCVGFNEELFDTFYAALNRKRRAAPDEEDQGSSKRARHADDE